MTTDNTSNLKSIDRTLQIIEAVRQFDGATVRDLADTLGIPKSTIYSHLSTLQNNGYIVKENSEYRLGLKFLELGEYTRRKAELYTITKRELEDLSERTGELAMLAVEENGDVVCLDVAKGENAIRHETHAGRRMPLHCTSIGKAILAFLPEDTREAILSEQELTEHTSFTITDMDELHVELQEIRDRGYAYDEQEYHRGLKCVGMPILDGRGNSLGSISVSGPSSRMEGDRFREEIPEQIRTAVNIIEVNLSQSSGF